MTITDSRVHAYVANSPKRPSLHFHRITRVVALQGKGQMKIAPSTRTDLVIAAAFTKVLISPTLLCYFACEGPRSETTMRNSILPIAIAFVLAAPWTARAEDKP
jgi:hypothetical protein